MVIVTKISTSIPLLVKSRLFLPGEIIGNLAYNLTEPLIVTTNGETVFDSSTNERIKNQRLVGYDGVAEYIARQNGWFYFPSQGMDDLKNQRSFSFRRLISALETVCQKIEDTKMRENAQSRLQSFKADRRYVSDEAKFRIVKDVGPEIRFFLKGEYSPQFNHPDLVFGLMQSGPLDALNFGINYKRLESYIDLNLISDFRSDRKKAKKFSQLISLSGKDTKIRYNSERNSITVFWSISDYNQGILSGIPKEAIQGFKTDVEHVKKEVNKKYYEGSK